MGTWADTFRLTQGYEAWQALGAWITEARPAFGMGVSERFQMASRVSSAQACPGAAACSTFDMCCSLPPLLSACERQVLSNNLVNKYISVLLLAFCVDLIRNCLASVQTLHLTWLGTGDTHQPRIARAGGGRRGAAPRHHRAPGRAAGRQRGGAAAVGARRGAAAAHAARRAGRVPAAPDHADVACRPSTPAAGVRVSARRFRFNFMPDPPAAGAWVSAYRFRFNFTPGPPAASVWASAHGVGLRYTPGPPAAGS